MTSTDMSLFTVIALYARLFRQNLNPVQYANSVMQGRTQTNIRLLDGFKCFVSRCKDEGVTPQQFLSAMFEYPPKVLWPNMLSTDATWEWYRDNEERVAHRAGAGSIKEFSHDKAAKVIAQLERDQDFMLAQKALGREPGFVLNHLGGSVSSYYYLFSPLAKRLGALDKLGDVAMRKLHAAKLELGDRLELEIRTKLIDFHQGLFNGIQ